MKKKTDSGAEKERKLRVIRKESRKLQLRLMLGVAVILVFAGALVIKQRASAPASEQRVAVAALAGHPFQLDIANTPALREQGLSNRPRMNDAQGMLFEYQQPDAACFWMKDMRFNLDILWFDADKKLIWHQQNLAPASYPQNFCPPSLATYVVEIRPGIIQLKIGDPLVLQKQ